MKSEAWNALGDAFALRHDECCASCWEAQKILREVAKGWEPGPGPFEVPMPLVNRIINLLADD